MQGDHGCHGECEPQAQTLRQAETGSGSADEHSNGYQDRVLGARDKQAALIRFERSVLGWLG